MTPENRQGTGDPRNTPLGRVTAVVYWFMVVEACFLLAAAPGFLGLMLLTRDASNIALFALCLVPLAPAFSAALFALDRRAAGADLVVWPVFWHGWLQNVVDVCKVWVPALVGGAILAVNLIVGGEAGVGEAMRVASGVLGVVLVLWAVNAVVIATFFRFRTRDVARLALFYLAARPIVSLGVISFLVILTTLITFASDWAAALAASLLAALLLSIVRPMRDDVRARFVEEEP
ncbi:hypothetical protein LKO27_10020 [Tessaracoccus sp. OS52]|uniref:hypothetical protein n=1 Tax=Tessaracoccus sp. OS52 TaxID=2886691 RepID=UPI001D0FFDF9|nr:hypothetical protein [Tessaracoccus sp. OS52]MCC2593740.1 hypothetical protein [Tessaracoccus sp. OS52]